LHFGWAAARLDDCVNLPASRLSGLLFAAAALLTGNDGRASTVAMWRDAGKHQSPNAGWPESALAGALGVSLGGPRCYGGELVDLAVMGNGRSQLACVDIGSGLRLYDTVLNLLLAGCVTAALLVLL
jgi:adenosylcobinamide-phosphate synthase